MPNSPNAFEIVWRKSVWLRAFVYTFVIVAIVLILARYWSGYAFALQVGLIGFTLAYILNPLVKYMARIKIGRPIAVIIIYLLLINFILLSSFLISQVVVELGSFVSLLPEALKKIADIGANMPEQITNLQSTLTTKFPFLKSTVDNQEISLKLQEQITLFAANFVTAINTQLNNVLRSGPNLLFSGASSIISTTLQGLLIIIASAYFLYDYPKFVANAKRITPVRWRGLFEDISLKLDKAVGGYFRGQLLISFALGVFIYIGLSIIGIPLALAISFLAAIFNLVPYLGPIIGVTPAILLGFTISPIKALLAVVVFIIANQIEGNILGPYILSKSTNLHPVTVLLAILAGAGIFGLVGALFAVPFVAFTKLLIDDYLLKTKAYQETAQIKAINQSEIEAGVSNHEG